MKRVRRFFSQWTNCLGLGIVLFFIMIALVTPLIAPDSGQLAGGYDASYARKVKSQQGTAPQPPTADAWLGTTVDRLDVFYWLVRGTGPTLAFSLEVSLAVATIGILIGLLAGYLSSEWGKLLMRVTDGFLAFPVIAAYFIFSQIQQGLLNNLPDSGYVVNSEGSRVLSAQGEWLTAFDPLMAALILLLWMPYARMIYGIVLSTKSSPYIESAISIGATLPRVLFRHLLPNTVSPAIVLLARDIGAVVILQASLSFAGFGNASPWGQLLLIGRNWITGAGGSTLHYWWVWLPATLFLILYGIGWNLIGDGINDALDPRAA